MVTGNLGEIPETIPCGGHSLEKMLFPCLIKKKISTAITVKFIDRLSGAHDDESLIRTLQLKKCASK